MRNIWHLVEKGESGEAEALYRFYEDDNGYKHEEYLAGGEWIQDNSLNSVLNNLHNPYYKEIDEEAAQIAPEFGGKIQFNKATV
ncbi:MAG: hypothetical protein ABI954_00705 [Pyrinomonadaceae bacterium]